MDFHAAMETFAEAWIAANMQNYVSNNTNKNELLTSSTTKDDCLSHPHPSRKNKVYTNLPENSKYFKSNTTIPSKSSTSMVSISLRCLVEQECLERAYHDVAPDVSINTLSDSVLDLPGSLPFLDIVESSLAKLGFSLSDATGAKGSIQLKSWNFLDIEILTSDKKISLEEMLGDIAPLCTLKIRLKSVDLDKIDWNDQTVRCAIVKLLKQYNQVTLAKMCPIPQSMISNIINSKYTAKVCPEKCKEFGQWYKKYREENAFQLTTIGGQYKLNTNTNTRLTFHPIHELPLMRKWYGLCPNPTSEELKKYLSELNAAPVRQERPKVPLKRLRIWWRNEKQRIKKMDDEKSGPSIGSPSNRKKRRPRYNLSSNGDDAKSPINPNNNDGMNGDDNDDFYIIVQNEEEYRLKALSAYNSNPAILSDDNSDYSNVSYNNNNNNNNIEVLNMNNNNNNINACSLFSTATTESELYNSLTVFQHMPIS